MSCYVSTDFTLRQLDSSAKQSEEKRKIHDTFVTLATSVKQKSSVAHFPVSPPRAGSLGLEPESLEVLGHEHVSAFI